MNIYMISKHHGMDRCLGGAERTNVDTYKYQSGISISSVFLFLFLLGIYYNDSSNFSGMYVPMFLKKKIITRYNIVLS